MRKLKEKLNNKKGFTLVELIVVIVIILILAAVLIPNVMRYISEASESAFQSEASSYLTELQGYEAENYAKNAADISSGDFGTSGDYDLTGLLSSSNLTVYSKDGGYAKMDSNTAVSKQKIDVQVDYGAVTNFSYSDGKYYVNWSQSDGWGKVTKIGKTEETD